MAAASEAVTAAPCIIVRTLAGQDVLRCDTIPANVRELKELIARSGYMPVALQKLLHEDGFAVCADEDVLEPKEQGMIVVRDETPLWHWDAQGQSQIDIEGGVVKCPRLSTDYTNVVTQEPVDAGLHYFEFHLHWYGDEQWCGLTPDKSMAGSEHSKAVPSKTGWFYYTGRRTGAIEAVGCTLKAVDFVERSRDPVNVIGMLVDCDTGAAAFDLNGKIQGACEIPKNAPLWVLTHVDTPEDHVELRKPSLQDAAPTNFEALKGALLDVSQGTAMTRTY